MFVCILIVGIVLTITRGAVLDYLSRRQTSSMWESAGAIVIFGKNGDATMLIANNHHFDTSSLGQIANYPTLRQVVLQNTAVTSQDLVHVGELKELESLVLNGTEVDDDAVNLIADVSSLKYLHLSNTHVSDASVPAIVKMRSLVELDVRETELSQEALEELSRRRPDLTVHSCIRH